MFEEN